MTTPSRAVVLTYLCLAIIQARAATPEAPHQGEVRELSAAVMPFDMAATTHVFTRTAHGGIQRVIVKTPSDTEQVRLIRAHLRELADRFGRRDFSGPAHVHGSGMPGLAELTAAAPQDLLIAYRDVPGGAVVEYTSNQGRIVAALHRWFDAQLADHGADAMMGHDHSMSHPN